MSHIKVDTDNSIVYYRDNNVGLIPLAYFGLATTEKDGLVRLAKGMDDLQAVPTVNTIKESIDSAKNTANSAKSSVDQLSPKVTSAEEKLAQLESTIQELQNKVSQLESKLPQPEGRGKK